MTTVKTVDFKEQTTTSSNVKQRRIKEDDNIFASYARKAGMENFADFLSRVFSSLLPMQFQLCNRLSLPKFHIRKDFYVQILRCF